MGTLTVDGYRIEPLSMRTWDAFADLAERHNGVWGGCWCTYFHLHPDPKEERRALGHREFKRRLVEAGRAHAALVFDGGYQGTGPITPAKRPPNGELTDEQKSYNHSLNRLRAAVERAIAHLKNWKILKTGYHRLMTDFPDLLRTVTALEIFRVWGPDFE